MNKLTFKLNDNRRFSSSNSGAFSLIKFIASSILPFSIDSRIFKRSSTDFKSILFNDKPASLAKISAASLNPSKTYFYSQVIFNI